ncbi:MAG: thiol-disulfide oxidoreductase DCC family protein [Acidobacteria bacterium]|nr:thiol-disulfide oxidoreductase DCC family protein [Acidobacteriota bacterium]
MGPIVLFDGVCNFCNGAVNWIIRHDPTKKFHFAPLQSEKGEDLQAKFAIPDDVDSIILIEGDKAYMHSTAGLRVAKHLGGPWSLGYAAIIVPAFIRDWAYKLFARNRYRLFGRQDACMLPTPDVRERFL